MNCCVLNGWLRLFYTVHHTTWGTTNTWINCHSFAFHNCMFIINEKEKKETTVCVHCKHLYQSKNGEFFFSFSFFLSFCAAHMSVSINLMNYCWFDLFLPNNTNYNSKWEWECVLHERIQTHGKLKVLENERFIVFRVIACAHGTPKTWKVN